MLYWLPGTGASSARLYWESFRQVQRSIARSAADTVARAGRLLDLPARRSPPVAPLGERRFTDIRYWNEPAKRRPLRRVRAARAVRRRGPRLLPPRALSRAASPTAISPGMGDVATPR